MAQAPIATAYAAIVAEVTGLRQTLRRELRAPVEQVSREAGEAGGRDLGRGLAAGLRRTRPTPKDLGVDELAAAVEKAEKRMSASVSRHSREQADAKRQVSIAQAKVNEATGKYEQDSSQALAATDRLIKAERILAEATSVAADEQDGLQRQLLESRAALEQAQQSANSTARGFTRAFNGAWAAQIQASMSSAMDSRLVRASAATAGMLAGRSWSDGFERGLDARRIGGAVSGALAKMSGLRAVGDFARIAGDAFQNMDRHVTALANSGTKIAGIAALATAAGGAILGVSSGFASMAATALALPGILTGAGVTLAILVASLNDFATVLPGVSAEYAKLGALASNNFWSVAAGPIERAAFVLLPTLRTGVAAVAQELGGWGVAIATTLSWPSSVAALATVFWNLRAAVDIAGDGVGQFTSGLLGLIGVGTSYLPALAGRFNRMAWSFDAWVQANIANGNMWGWIDAGLAQFSYLGQTIGATIGVLGGLQRAAVAAGSPQGFGALATGMQAVETAVNSSPWQTALIGFFQGANDGVRALAGGFALMVPGLQGMLPVLGEVMSLTGQTIGGILAGVGDLMAHPAVQGGIVTFFTAVRDSVVQLAPSAGVLGDLFGALASLAAQLVFAIAGTLDVALKAVGPAFVGVSEAVRPLIPALSSIAQSIITGMGPAFEFIGGLITTVVVPPMVGLAEFLSGFPQVLGVVGVALTGVGVALGVATAAAVAGKVALLAKAVAVHAYHGALLIASGVTKAMAAGQWLLNAALTANPIGLVVVAIAGLVAGLILAYNRVGWFKDFVNSAWAAIKSVALTVWDGIRAVIGGVADWLTGTVAPGIGATANRIGSVFTWLHANVVVPVWTGIKTAVAVAAAAVMTIGDGLVAFYRVVLAPTFTWLRDSVVLPVWNGIRSAISTAWNWVRDVVLSPLMGFIRGPLTSTWNHLRALVGTVWSTIRSTVSSAWNWVRDSVLVPANSFLRSTVGGAWQWLRDRVSAVWSGIRTAVSTAWNWVRDTVLSPAVSFVRGAVVGSWTFLRDRVSDVWSSVRNTISGVWSAIKSRVIDPMVNTVRNTVVSAFERARDGIRTAWTAIKGIVAKPVEFVINTVIRDGFVANFNKIARKFKIPEINFGGVNLSGFRSGGRTGGTRDDEVRGPAHGNEFVFSAPRTRQLDRAYPGMLDDVHAHGPAALGRHLSPGHMAVGSPVYAGYGSFSNPLQRQIYASGKLSVAGSAPGWGLNEAIGMLDRATRVQVGRNVGGPTVNVSAGPMGAWWAGYYEGHSVRLNSSAIGPGVGRRTVAAHELGHALGLPHSDPSGLRSIMSYANMFQHNSVTGADVAALSRIYGGTGFGSGGGSSVEDDKPGIVERIVSKLVDKIGFGGLKDRIPGGGFMLELMKGAADHIWDQFKSWVRKTVDAIDISKLLGIGDGEGLFARAPSIARGAHLSPTLYDGGGWLRNTGEAQLVAHRESKPDAVLTNREWAQQRQIAAWAAEHRAGQTAPGWVSNGPVFAVDPDELWETQRRQARRQEVLYGIR